MPTVHAQEHCGGGATDEELQAGKATFKEKLKALDGFVVSVGEVRRTLGAGSSASSGVIANKEKEGKNEKSKKKGKDTEKDRKKSKEKSKKSKTTK